MSHYALARAALTVPAAACSRTATRVLFVAAHVADTQPDGTELAILHRAWVASVLGCGPVAVQRAVRELLAAGLLAEHAAPRRLSGRHWQPTTYVVLPPGGERDGLARG